MIEKKLNNVNPKKLIDELTKKGIKIIYAINDSSDGEHIANNTIIDFEDNTDMELVQQIIDAHDPTPLPEPLSEIDKLKISQAEQFETILMIVGGM